MAGHATTSRLEVHAGLNVQPTTSQAKMAVLLWHAMRMVVMSSSFGAPASQVRTEKGGCIENVVKSCGPTDHPFMKMGLLGMSGQLSNVPVSVFPAVRVPLLCMCRL